MNSVYQDLSHHTRADTLGKVDVALLGKVADGLTDVLTDLAGERRLAASRSAGSASQ
jgi:hypothetical protein